MPRLICFASVWLPLLASLAVHASDTMDDYILAEMKSRQIPGLALAVVRDGKIIRAQAYGLADIENDVPMTTDGVFELASLTKQFTATAIMMLVEDGKLALDDRISQYLPNPSPNWNGMTIRQLLTHTAGLAKMGADFRTLHWTNLVTTQEMYAAAFKDPILSAPGEKWQYSDEGYFLLGMILEKASGKSYADFMAERIFKPLEMSHTSVLDLYAIIKHRVHGYTLYNGRLINIHRVSQVQLPSHYGIFSTLDDLAKWDAALYSERLLKKSSLDQMWTPVRLNSGATYPYGFGWDVDRQNGHRWVGHRGITGTQITRYLDDRLTIIVLHNLGTWATSSTSDAKPWGLSAKIAEFYLPELKAK